jgi:hypothetical protein
VYACCKGAGAGGDATAAIRARLRLRADLSACAEAAARDALAACTALPMEALQADADAGAEVSPLASLSHDSLLLVFWHLPHAAAEAATLTCAAWAHAGLADVASRLSVRPLELRASSAAAQR